MSEIENKLRNNVVLPLWPDTGQVLNLKRNATYAAAARGEIKTIRFGHLKRVPTAWLRAKLGLDHASEAAE
jgi:hypothetical protein